MSMPTVLIIVAALLTLVHESQADGKSLLGWAVLFLCIALLWGNLNL